MRKKIVKRQPHVGSDFCDAVLGRAGGWCLEQKTTADCQGAATKSGAGEDVRKNFVEVGFFLGGAALCGGRFFLKSCWVGWWSFLGLILSLRVFSGLTLLLL